MDEMPDIQILTASSWKDYELIDSGDGEKLERYGSVVFRRPEAQAVWSRLLPSKKWDSADAVFHTTGEENGGHWIMKRQLPPRWSIAYHDLKCWVQPGGSRHLGLFPEQAAHWDWMTDLIRASKSPTRVLNLFGYTGLATLAAAQAGADVTHVDASKKALTWARDNQTLSGCSDKPIRWIVDDAVKFVQREARRNSSYHGIILDPPKFGRGPKGEVWEFFELLPDLLNSCFRILDSRPLFVIFTAYAVKSSALTLYSAMHEYTQKLQGKLEIGELATPDRSGQRLISHAIFARWSRQGG